MLSARAGKQDWYTSFNFAAAMNARGGPGIVLASIAFDEYQRALDLNLLSVVAMCTAAVPSMQTSGWGRIVGITSVTVRQPSTALILSNTARAGATAFLKTLALEVGRHAE